MKLFFYERLKYLQKKNQNVWMTLKNKKRILNVKNEKYSIRDIERIFIEFCTICNLRCRYCYLKQNDRLTFLPLKHYRKLLIELTGNKKYRKNIILEWPLSGCFFLHPQYKEIVCLTAEYKKRYPHFSPRVVLNDNMMLFDKEKVDFIFQQGVVNEIICSIDGVNKESFEYMRPGVRFEIVKKNMLYLLKKNQETENRLVIRINCGNDDFSIRNTIDPFFNKIFKKVDYVMNWYPQDWNDSFHTKSPVFKPLYGLCPFVLSMLTISSSGTILKCCNDLQGLTKYGDFTSDTLESIWLSRERKLFLKLMYKDKRQLVPGCNNCSIGFARTKH